MSIQLSDDGTLDTVLKCSECGEEFRYNIGDDDEPRGEDSSAAYDRFVEWAIDDATDEHLCLEAPLVTKTSITAEECIEAAQALHWFCANHHEGQFSERYRVLTAVGYKPGAFERGPDLETVAPTYYRELVGGGWNASDMLDAINAAYAEVADEHLCLPSEDAIETMLTQYIETALWSSTDESDEGGGNPLDESFDESDLTDEARAEMRKDCADFLESNAADIGDKYDSAGHNFWLNRNGHGAGFWDSSDFPGETGQRLSEACRPYGSQGLYVGDDGKLHVGG